MITISKNQLELVRSLLKAYMYPSMYYKLGLENSLDSFNYKSITELTQFSKAPSAKRMAPCIYYNDMDFGNMG